MNVREKLQGRLVNMGMFESQAYDVMEDAIPKLNELVEDYSITFERDSDEYPDVIYDVLMLAIKPIALDWIINNKPEAWFKEMFK